MSSLSHSQQGVGSSNSTVPNVANSLNYDLYFGENSLAVQNLWTISLEFPCYNWVIGRFFGEKGDRYVDIFNNSFMRYRSLSC